MVRQMCQVEPRKLNPVMGKIKTSYGEIINSVRAEVKPRFWRGFACKMNFLQVFRFHFVYF